MSSFAVSFLSSVALFSLVPAYASERSDLALKEMVELAAKHRSGSVFVFDLDETIVDSTPRRFASLMRASHGFCSPNGEVCDWYTKLRVTGLYRLKNRYDDAEFLRRAGVGDEVLIHQITAVAFGIYLSGAYIVEKDELYAGAKAFIQALKVRGAKVYFVSSRSKEHQLEPTLTFLKREGLMRNGEEGSLYLKPDREESPDFKRRATAEIAKRTKARGAKVDGIFENEPENMKIWMETFPDAQPFFVEGAYQHEGPVSEKAIRLKNFRLGRPHNGIRMNRRAETPN